MAECPCCGQTLPPDLPKGLKLRGRKLEVFNMVRRAGQYGITADRIFDRLYELDPNGGPDKGLKIISVFVCYLNKRLRPFGMRVRAEPNGGRGGVGLSPYRLEHVA